MANCPMKSYLTLGAGLVWREEIKLICPLFQVDNCRHLIKNILLRPFPVCHA